jgi:LPXTG-motif cell wall-anchored protein
MLKRTMAVLATGAIAAIVLAPSAGALDDPKLDPYGAGAYATALQLTLLGQDLAVSTSSAAITSKPEAKADGAALLLAGTPIPGAAPSAAPGGPATNEVCAIDIDLAELTGGAISLAEAGVACVETTATASGEKTEATSASGEVIINVLAPGGTALEPILTPLFAGVTQVTDPLIEALCPLICEGGVVDELTDIDLATVLNGLLEDLQDETIVLAQVAVAPTASVTRATNAEGVLAQAGASGATIRLLPGLAPSLIELGLNLPGLTEPLATVKVGVSSANVTRDPVTGAADASASFAKILDVQLADTLGILEQLTGVVSDALEGLSTGPLGCNDSNPLRDILCIDLGEVKDLSVDELKDRNLYFGEGTVGREATAAAIHVLPIAAEALGGDVLGLLLGQSTAAANATPAAAPTPPPAIEKLPKTGAATSIPLALGLLGLAGASVALLRRTRTAQL